MTMRKLFLPLIFVLSGCGDNTDPADTSTTAKEHTVFSVETENPSDYIASGHNCYLFISNNAREVKISKSACQAVFFDKTDVPGGDLTVKLDKEKVPMTDDGKSPRAGCLKAYSPEPDNDYWTCPRQD